MIHPTARKIIHTAIRHELADRFDLIVRTMEEGLITPDEADELSRRELSRAAQELEDLDTHDQ